MSNTKKPSEVLDEMKTVSKSRLHDKTEVVDTNPPIDSGTLFSQAIKWRKYENVVAVFADLKGSTKLGADGMWDKSTASIYDAAIEPMATIFDNYGCDYISIQGDGGFALYTGDLAVERAMCAAVTLQTFSSHHLAPLIEDRWKDSSTRPVTGFKTGVATSTLLARKVGIPRTSHSAPVWAGRAVNYAAKCSQQAGVHHVLITRPIYDEVSKNDYLAFSCGCPNGGFSRLWTPTTIEHVGSKDSEGGLLENTWCSKHGDDFCAAVLAGERHRDEVKHLRAQLTGERRAS